MIGSFQMHDFSVNMLSCQHHLEPVSKLFIRQ